MSATTITRATINDDTGDGESGTVLNAAFFASAIYDKIDALLSANLELGANLTIDGSLKPAAAIIQTGVCAPSVLGASQNDYAPSASGQTVANSSILRISSSLAINITGLTAGSEGQRLMIHNNGNFAITLKNSSASSSANNRFNLVSGDLSLSVDAIIECIYTSTKWRVIGRT